MSAPTTSFLLNQTAPAAPSGDQNAAFQSDGATPEQQISVYPKRATGSLYGTTLLPVRKVILSFPSAVTGPVKGFVQVDYSGTILGWAAFGDGATGSTTVEVWKKAGTPPPTTTPPSIPTSSDKISASAPVTISSAQSAAVAASGVSTWATTAVAAGDSFSFNVVTLSTFTSITVELYIQQS